jgi:hypothetical protein
MRHARAGWASSMGVALLMDFGSERAARAAETPEPSSTVDLTAAVEPDLAALSAPDFFKALERRFDWQAADKSEMWFVLDRCRAELDAEGESEPSREHFLRAWSCGRAGEALAATAEGSERLRLLEGFDAIPPSSPIRDALLRGLLASALAEKIRALEAGAASPEGAAHAGTPLPELPAGLAKVSIDLQNAWRLKMTLGRAYHERLEAIQEEKGQVPVHREEAAFHGAVTDFLRERVGASETIVSLARYVWGGGCGMGSQSLFGPQTQTLLLAFLAVGDHEAAAGALVSASAFSHFDLPASSKVVLEEGWEARLLRRLGFDWEPIFLGRVLDGDQSAAVALARRGSDRAARLLFEARTVSPFGNESALGDQDGYLHALATLVTPTDRCRDYGTSSSLDTRRSEDAEAVGADLEADVLELLASHVRPGGSRREAETAAHLLVKACRPESLPAFRTMTRSVYSRVRDAGALALRSYGERAPRRRENAPVVYVVTIEGAPLGERRVEWALERRAGGGYSFRESSAAMTVGGRLSLERDPFLDPKAAVDTVTLSTGRLSGPGDLWFSVTLPRSESLDRATPVRVETQSLAIRCPDAGAEDLRVSLNAEEPRWGEDAFVPILDDVPLSGAAPLVFPRLQRGPYQVVVRGPTGTWESERITLGVNPVEVTCGPLEPTAESELDGLIDEVPAILRF